MSEQTITPLRAHSHVTRHLLTFDKGRTYCMATKVTGADGVSRLVERTVALTGAEVETARRLDPTLTVKLVDAINHAIAEHEAVLASYRFPATVVPVEAR